MKVREDLGEVFDIGLWDKRKREMIGKIYTIEQVHSTNEGIYYSIKIFNFRHDWLLPILKTKRTVDDVLAGLSDEDKEIIMERLK